MGSLAEFKTASYKIHSGYASSQLVCEECGVRDGDTWDVWG